MRTPLRLRFPADFHFEHTVYSHGWCALFPFCLDREGGALTRTVVDDRGGRGLLRVTLPSQRHPHVDIDTHGRPSTARLARFTAAARAMLHLDLDLRPLYDRIRGDAEFSWIAEMRTGRMLRGETFFEDVVKMILTTNCAWSLTEIMNANLVARFGDGEDIARQGFPSPDAIADSSEAFLRREVRLGYRAPYVLDLARRVASGGLDIESFRTATAPAKELHQALRGIKGVGDYAAGNLLKLLGRYDYLGLDSWCRAKFAELHHGGVAVDDRTIARKYEPYGEWKGLVMWLDVTRRWYADKFPF